MKISGKGCPFQDRRGRRDSCGRVDSCTVVPDPVPSRRATSPRTSARAPRCVPSVRTVAPEVACRVRHFTHPACGDRPGEALGEVHSAQVLDTAPDPDVSKESAWHKSTILIVTYHHGRPRPGRAAVPEPGLPRVHRSPSAGRSPCEALRGNPAALWRRPLSAAAPKPRPRRPNPMRARTARRANPSRTRKPSSRRRRGKGRRPLPTPRPFAVAALRSRRRGSPRQRHQPPPGERARLRRRSPPRNRPRQPPPADPRKPRRQWRLRAAVRGRTRTRSHPATGPRNRCWPPRRSSARS